MIYSKFQFSNNNGCAPVMKELSCDYFLHRGLLSSVKFTHLSFQIHFNERKSNYSCYWAYCLKHGSFSLSWKVCNFGGGETVRRTRSRRNDVTNNGEVSGSPPSRRRRPGDGRVDGSTEMQSQAFPLPSHLRCIDVFCLINLQPKTAPHSSRHCYSDAQTI